MFDLQEKLRTLPEKSGVYIMKNASGEVIYVGKAKVLKNRVKQYFTNKNHPPKVQAMVNNIASFEYILSDNELEAFVLENNLIKKHLPKYNILLKDDKTYPFLKITLTEDYPRLVMARRVVSDGSKYFGPYLSAKTIYELIELIKEIFMIRSCHKPFSGDFKKSRPCLYYQIGKCMGVCTKDVDKTQYRKVINEVIDFLEGNYDKVKKELYQKMMQASDNLDFERAGLYRDRINAIDNLSKKQKIVSPDGKNTDVIAKFSDNNQTCIEVFFIRGGSMIGKEHYYLDNTDDIEDSTIISDFIMQYYTLASFIPQEIFLQYDLEDAGEIKEYLKSVSKKAVAIKAPKIGDNAKLVKMVEMNAKKELYEHQLSMAKDANFLNTALAGLMKLLQLNGHPLLIEAYDISNISGTHKVGAMVTFKNGKKYPEGYKNFKIKSIDGQDDYACMKEVLTRRFSNAKKGEKGFENLPQLVLVDGGAGHLAVAKEVIDKLYPHIPVFGVVKDDNHKTRGLVGEQGEIYIDPKSEEFMLLTRIQDEMHRRAISYHTKLRDKSSTRSVLDGISGIGSVRKKALLKHFKTIKNIKNASYDELMLVKEMDASSARAVVSFFAKENKNGK